MVDLVKIGCFIHLDMVVLFPVLDLQRRRLADYLELCVVDLVKMDCCLDMVPFGDLRRWFTHYLEEIVSY